MFSKERSVAWKCVLQFIFLGHSFQDVIDVAMWRGKARLLVVIANPQGRQFGGWLLLTHEGSAGAEIFIAWQNIAGVNQQSLI